MAEIKITFKGLFFFLLIGLFVLGCSKKENNVVEDNTIVTSEHTHSILGEGLWMDLSAAFSDLDVVIRMYYNDLLKTVHNFNKEGEFVILDVSNNNAGQELPILNRVQQVKEIYKGS